jgi:hypothetical protein
MSPRLTGSVAVALLAILAGVGTGHAQSLSPLTKTGDTPSDRKAFRLDVGNPYNRRMTFAIVPMLPDYATPATGVIVNRTKLTMAPGVTRQVIVTFEIDPAKKERTIALCVMPEDLDGPILPRVCGLYTGRMAGHGG